MRTALTRLFDEYPDLTPCQSSVEAAAELLLKTFQTGHMLLVAGNGGSASDADHIVGELVKACARPRPLSRLLVERLNAMGLGTVAQRLQRGLPTIALASHASLSTAIINDQGADLMFAQQVIGYGKPGDTLWALSTSGNSTNIVVALQVARALEMQTVGLTGDPGGRMSAYCDVLVRVPYTSTQTIQERHLPIYHALCLYIEEVMYGI
ncbi:MAG: phosphoheptose isomerase [Sulfobacillus acidophilus]|uniref:Phosphoheptose isomerase n=1 Tax=Sulfobacillus acidophilus TaxID=53633 RepID=A0A2T2WKG0_9FIRM|nr:MAG: phosphoheptose isomerase [Sulfobacillus acidophilus]